MASWDDVRRIALALPETSEGASYGDLAWKVRGTSFVWERPLRASDVALLGHAAPSGPILGARVAGLDTKDALLRESPGCCFTIPHFDGYPAVLVQLDRVPAALLTELVTDAWLARAPKRLAAGYLAEHAG